MESEGRSSEYAELEVEEERPSAIDVTSDVDVEFDNDGLLAITDERWSIDDERATLIKAARGNSVAGPTLPPDRPAVAAPSPFDFGRADEDTLSLKRGRSVPPPLPGTKSSALPPPLPQETSPSKRPPPLPPLKGDLSEVPSKSPARPSTLPDEGTRGAMLLELLDARITHLVTSDDLVTRARAHLERAVVQETLGDDATVDAELERALSFDPNGAAAHTILRRRIHARSRLPAMRKHVEHEMTLARSDARIVELLAERARLFDAEGLLEEARTDRETALAKDPNHPAVLRGLEHDLLRKAFESGASADAWEALATHLGRMSEAYAKDPSLVAWLHVERAWILDLRLGRTDAARGAFERALRTDPGLGPVRDAFMLFAAAHHDATLLATLLTEEARIESQPARKARLELDAACIALGLLGDETRAVELLERAVTRAPTTPSVDRRVLDDLVRLHERAARFAEAARARRLRLRFFTDPTSLVYELRRLASLEERLGRLEVAASDLSRATTLDPTDTLLAEELDRLLAASAKDDERLAFWHARAQAATSAEERANALIRCAKMAEDLGDREGAHRHLRAAWASAPGRSDIVDPLSRLLSRPPSNETDREIRALVDLYAEAARSTTDEGRRIAYLEKVALLSEEITGDLVRATRVYEEILTIAPGLRGAILGLERTAARTSDARALAKALFEESNLAENPVDALTLRVRSADVLAPIDPARALAVVLTVIAEDSAHLPARVLETRLHEEAGRWEQAGASIRKRIDLATSTKEKVSLWLALAQIQDARLKAPKDAVESLRNARSLDPSHPVPPEEIARILEAAGDVRELRAAVELLATEAVTDSERVRHLVRAAEIDEFVLADDVSAEALYTRALEATPEDALVAERRTRVLARRALATASGVGPGVFETEAWSSLVEHLSTCASMPSDHPTRFDFMASELRVVASESNASSASVLARATRDLERILDDEPRHVGALRLLETIAHRTASVEALHKILERQGAALSDDSARLGALWQLAALEAWRWPAGETLGTYKKILDRANTDHGAHEATLRLSLGAARKGDAPARTTAIASAIASLRALAKLADDDSSRMTVNVRLALLLVSAASDKSLRDRSAVLQREALDRLVDVLAIDGSSVTAATVLAELAERCNDVRAAVLAATSLADLSVQPTVRAKYFTYAAHLVWTATNDAWFGPSERRAERAATLLVSALSADPDAVVAVRRLSRIRQTQNRDEALLDVFQSALARAKDKDAIVLLGSEIARVSRDKGLLSSAIEAMRHVRTIAPDHVPSLLTLSELFIAEHAWPEAIEVLEAVVSTAKDPAPRVTALFALAGIHEKVLERDSEAEKMLRRALDIDDVNPRALRLLVRRLATRQEEAPSDEGKLEIAGLLSRLAQVEPEDTVKADILLELAELRVAMKDLPGAERALVDATATSPTHPRAFARLTRFFRTNGAGGEVEPVSYARALAALVAKGNELGKQDARWYATLGHIQVAELRQLREGVTNLERALELDPNLHTCRVDLATAHLGLRAYELATKTVLAMLQPTAEPLFAVSDPAATLELLERAFSAERKQEEAIVVSELRAIAGALDEGRRGWLRARKLGAFEDHHTPIDRATLVNQVVPEEGRHAWLDVAAAVQGIESKILRADLSELGIAPRDRVGRRSGNPTRVLFDRLVRALELDDVELVVTPNVSRLRVVAQDNPWILVPKALTELPESSQLSAIARALSRIALGVPWLEELPPTHIQALLVAAARNALPTYAEDLLDEPSRKLVGHYEPLIGRELSRKHKQALEKLNATLATPEARPLPIDVFIHTLARAELRAAYVLTGDTLATIDELRRLDTELARATESPGTSSLSAVLDHPFAGDVARFALGPDTTPLRRRVGATWAGL